MNLEGFKQVVYVNLALRPIMKQHQTITEMAASPVRGYQYLGDLPALQKLPWIFLITLLGSLGLAPVLEGDVVAGWVVFLAGLPVAINSLDQTTRYQLSERLGCVGYFGRGLRGMLRMGHFRGTLTSLAEAWFRFAIQRLFRMARNHKSDRWFHDVPTTQFLIASSHAFRPPPASA